MAHEKRFILFEYYIPIPVLCTKHSTLHVFQLTLHELKSMIRSWGGKARVVSCTFHPTIDRAISQALEVELERCSESYMYDPSDTIVVIVPRKRVDEVKSPDDLEAYLVTVETT